MSFIDDFLGAIDACWDQPADPKIPLQVLGSTALFMRTDYVRGTKDGDVFRTKEIDGAIAARLLKIGGAGTPLANEYGVYLDIVSRNVPLLPHKPLWHPYDLNLVHFDVRVLDVVDVVLSKLRRYNTSDQDDIRAMADGGHIDHPRMVQRFREIVEGYRFDARASDLPEMVDRFHEIEEEWLYEDATEFNLPDWIGES